MATGAFRFTVEPGASTEVDVEAHFFPRKDLTEIGLAPLTSMFNFAPHDAETGTGDYRPRVHDSDGLSVRMANGEWVWRPLANPQKLEISTFTERAPLGFGLMQRDRDFEDYQDLEARYDRRPGVWITPTSDWGAGYLTLVEIPTTNEFNDNIVSFWRPADTWKKGEERTIAYRMNWGGDAPLLQPIARVEGTRTGIAQSGRRLFVIDFTSENESLFEGAVPYVSTSSGSVRGAVVVKNPETGGMRLTFELDGQGGDLAELRAVLLKAGKPVSETWLYRWRK